MARVDIGPISGIPQLGARVLRVGATDIAVFRTGDDRVFALLDRCPHRGGPLSQGIVHGARVTCPLHDWVIELDSGAAVSPDEGCVQKFATGIDAGRVYVDVPEDIHCLTIAGAES